MPGINWVKNPDWNCPKVTHSFSESVILLHCASLVSQFLWHSLFVRVHCISSHLAMLLFHFIVSPHGMCLFEYQPGPYQYCLTGQNASFHVSSHTNSYLTPPTQRQPPSTRTVQAIYFWTEPKGLCFMTFRKNSHSLFVAGHSLSIPGSVQIASNNAPEGSPQIFHSCGKFWC